MEKAPLPFEKLSVHHVKFNPKTPNHKAYNDWKLQNTIHKSTTPCSNTYEAQCKAPAPQLNLESAEKLPTSSESHLRAEAARGPSPRQLPLRGADFGQGFSRLSSALLGSCVAGIMW